MIKLFSKKRTVKENRTVATNQGILYNSCDIPAKLFYNEVIGKSNLNALGEGTQKELEAAFYSILDELCELENNNDLRSLYQKAEKISRIQSVISTIEAIIHAIKHMSHIMTDEQVNNCIKQLNSITYIMVRFDVKKGIAKEIERVEKSVIGILRNHIAQEQDVEKKKTEKVKMSFEKEVLNLAMITGVRLSDTDTLRYFIELKNIAKEKIKSLNKGKNGK